MTPPPSSTPPPFVPSGAPRRRKRAPIVIGVIALIALLGGGIALIATRGGGSSSPNDTGSFDTGAPDTGSFDTTPATTPDTNIFDQTGTSDTTPATTPDTATFDTSPIDTAQSLAGSSAAGAAVPDPALDAKLLAPIDLESQFGSRQATGKHVDPEIDFMCLVSPLVDVSSAREGSVMMVATGDTTKKIGIAVFQFASEADAKAYVAAADQFARNLTTGNECDLEQIEAPTADSVGMARRTDPQGVVGSIEFRAVGQFVVFAAIIDPTGVGDDAAFAIVDQQVQALVTGDTSPPPTT